MGSGNAPLPAQTRWFVYISHALSTWGDRMWSFGVGLFMVIISPESLRVTAVYGLSMGGAILLFGALVGDWVDRTPRLKAARTALVIQNVSVSVCAVIVFVVVTWKAQIVAVWADEGLLMLCYALIILVAIIASLASLGMNIAVQRDWIVEICGRDTDLLATMSATLRRIDLMMMILSPIATGQIMTYASVSIGALFIGGWNVASVFVEYYLLFKVYDMVPALRAKKDRSRLQKDPVPLDPEEEAITSAGFCSDNLENLRMEIRVEASADDTETSNKSADKTSRSSETSNKSADKTSRSSDNAEDIETVDHSDDDAVQNGTSENGAKQLQVINEHESRRKSESASDTGNVTVTVTRNKAAEGNTGDEAVVHGKDGSDGDRKTEKSSGCGRFVRRMFSGILILGRGWRTYMKYDVAFAGLGLSALYMTVLGFDNITVGYAYSQGVNESIMGVLMAGGALTGILGTILYPAIRRCIGLERTGLFGFLFEISFLSLCVASVWAPGSPFDPFNSRDTDIGAKCVLDNSTYLTNSTKLGNSTRGVYNVSSGGLSPTIGPSVDMSTLPGSADGQDSGVASVCSETERDWQQYISVSLLMAGIIGARCGLWMCDLTITQLFLENIKESERGIINGVQTSLNKLMDMLKFVLVIAAPEPHTFGILVLISFAFICFGWMLYARYSQKVRGHLFHFEKMRKCKCIDAKNNNVNESGSAVVDV